MSNVLTIWTVLCALQLLNAQYIVEVLSATSLGPRKTVQKCDATGANFGMDIVSFSFGNEAIGKATSVDPPDACGPVRQIERNSTEVNFAIVPRSQCKFSEKAFFVQKGRYDALIVFAKEGEAPVEMDGDKYAEQIRIPVLMISYLCMKGIMDTYPASKGYLVQIKISPGYYDLFRYLIPFVVVVGFCFTVLVISLLIRLCRERRRIARKRLSKRNLKKIPTRRFKTGEEPETCAICLDDFIEDEKLRVLPCRHVYHCKCIDPWLTRNRKVCPMCKRRVGDKASDSESSGDERVAPILVDQNRYQQLHEDQSSNHSMIVAFSPNDGGVAGSSSSQVMVDVHHDERTGSQEHLVVDGSAESDVERGLIESDDYAVNTVVPSSLKDRLKGLMSRVSKSPSRAPLQPESQPPPIAEVNVTGQDNAGFDRCSVSSNEVTGQQRTSGEQQPPAQSGSQAKSDEATVDPVDEHYYDPFEDPQH